METFTTVVFYLVMTPIFLLMLAWVIGMLRKPGNWPLMVGIVLVILAIIGAGSGSVIHPGDPLGYQ